MSLVRIPLACLALTFVLVSSAYAETAVKWTDSSGTVFYGTKPPAGAKKVEKLNPKNYSRYSGSKSLRPFTSSASTNNTSASRASLKRSSVTETPIEIPDPALDIQPNVKPDAIPEQTVKLENASPEVKSSAKGEISSCRVTVTNRSLIDIEGIQVAFEFADGTLISADGPSRLNAKQAAIYSIPNENLPLLLAPGTKSEPKVLLNSDADLQ